MFSPVTRFGLQKMTLLDFPDKVACTVFSPGCNFRCPFCHNASIVLAEEEENGLFSRNEILDFLRKRSGILDGVALTGGEPLLHEEIMDFIEEIKSLGFLLKLDTNGSFPDRLRNAVEKKLVDYVAVDIKNSPEKYGRTGGFENPRLLENVKESVSFLLHGTVPYEFRTTVVKGFHEAEDFDKIGQWISGCSKYYLQKFTDSGNLIEKRTQLEAVGDDEMRRYLQIVRKYVPKAELRGMEE